MRVSFYGNTEMSVQYFNDVHSQPKYVRNFKTASDTFDKEHKGKLTYKIAGGDICMDRSIAANSLILKLMDVIGLDASSVGNHDLEGGDYLSKAIEKVRPKFQFLSANIDFTRNNQAQKHIAKSMVIERKGEQVGLIGISPLDSKDLVFSAPFNDYMDVMNFDKTKKAVKEEVDFLEKQGINKIFLLAHTGKDSKEGTEYYKELAKIGGIDVIFGGHDHKEFDLWYKSDRNEPVKVVSAGKADDKDIVGENLDSFGVLDAVFDDDGVLIPEKCKNKIEITENYPKSPDVEAYEEKFLHSSKVISSTNKDLQCSNRVTEENPVADLAADAMLYVVNKTPEGGKAQIALINSGTVRGDFKKGDITLGMARQAFPFTSNTLIKRELSKKELFDALNSGAESTTYQKVVPGLIQVGGLKYTIDKNSRVKDVFLLNEDGSLGEKLDDQPDNKKYIVAYDNFLETGAVGLSSLKKDPKDPNTVRFPHARQDALIEYLREKFPNKPVAFVGDRITFETANKEEDCNLEPVSV